MLNLYDKGRLDEEFDLDGNGFQRWHDEIAAWLDDSRYAVRTEQIEWLKEASPWHCHVEGGATH
jgi:hypothetical protein